MFVWSSKSGHPHGLAATATGAVVIPPGRRSLLDRTAPEQEAESAAENLVETVPPAFRFFGAGDQVRGTDTSITFDGALSVFCLTAVAA